MLLALALPGMVLASGIALSLQSSSTRRFNSGAWASYLAGEVAEGAIAEAAHHLKVDDIFDPKVFGAEPDADDMAVALLSRMVRDQAPRDPTTNLFPSLPVALREYRSVMRGGAEVRKLFTAFRFPARTVTVTVPGVARSVARRNPGVRVSDQELAVQMTPLSFRREYYPGTTMRFPDTASPGGMRQTEGPAHLWVSWGVVRFRVSVRVDDLRSSSVHRLEVDRRFAIRSDVKPGEDALKISSLNLRSTMRQVTD